MPDMHSTGLRVVGAWLFAIVLILFSTVFVHIPYTREIQMVLAIPVLLFFGAPFYAGAWKGTRSGRNNIDRLVALTTSVAFLFSVFNTFFPDYWLGIGLEPHVYYGVAAVIIAFSLTGEFMEERARRTVSAAICRLGGWQHNAARVLPEKQRIDDRVAELFVPVILIISLLTFFIWVFFGGIDVVSHGLFAALSVLVVACPCAVGLATPVALAAGLNKAARNHILIRDTSALEQMRNVDVVVFDKTGTLTKGEFSVNRIEPEGMSETELLDLAACAEAFSDHPISKSIIGRLGHDIDPSRISDSSAIPGKGVEAMVDGRVVTVGNVRMMKECGIDLESEGDRSETNVYVAVDGKYAGRLVISDGLKDDAEDAVSSLKDMGVRTYMLTGDTEPVGKAVAERLRLDGYRAEMLPGDKTSELERIMSSSEGKTCFVGDGINDSPALARADVGIAMGCIGSDSAVEAADVVILDDSPSKVASSIRISKRTQTIVAENIVLALAVKFAILALTAFTDAVDMWIAIFGDVGVLVIAVLNAVRALRIPRGDARNRMSEERCGD